MCLPLAVIGALAAAGGMGMQYAGQKKADHALSRAFSAERGRQQAFQQDQIGAYKDSLDSVARMATPEAQDAAAANRLNAFKAVTLDANPAVTGYLPSAGSAPQIVADAGAAAGARENATTSKLSQALANMAGMGDLQFGTDINIGRNSQKIGQIGGFMRGSMDALQPELDAAKLKGQGLRTLGGLAQSIGMAMLSGRIGGGAGAQPVSIAGLAKPAASAASYLGNFNFAALPGMAI